MFFPGISAPLGILDHTLLDALNLVSCNTEGYDVIASELAYVDERKQSSHSIACCSPQTNFFGPYVRLFGLGIMVEVSVGTYVGHPYTFSSAFYLFIEESTHP